MASETVAADSPPAPAPRGLVARVAAWWASRRASGERAERERGEVDSKREQIKRLKERRLVLTNEAEVWAQAIPEKLKQLGVCYRRKDASRKGRAEFDLIKIRRPYVLTEEAIYLEVDLRPGRLPYGVGIENLEPDNVLRNLGSVVGHKVTCKHEDGKGFWYVVERQFGVRGIPAHVDYNAMLLSRPASASGLYIPLGIGENKKARWADLGQMPHMLIGGTTNAGKSNGLNAILCSLLRFNSPRRLKLVLVDLKGGVEFAYYLGVPHIWTVKDKEGGPDLAAVVERREQVIPWFERVLHEGERRMLALRDARCKNIGQYNARAGQRKPWPHIVVVIDEWRDIRLDSKISGKAQELLINMAGRFRAVGIHLIVTTQVPNKDVVPLALKSVLPARVAYACPNVHASIAIIGDGRAVGLEPQGRNVLEWGKEKRELQAPRINDDAIDATVRQAMAGKWDEVTLGEHDVTHQEIFEWAVNDNLGHLDVRALYGKFRVRGITQEWAKAFCKDVEGDIAMVGATSYRVMAGAGKLPRRLLPVELVDDGEEAEPTFGAGALAVGVALVPTSETVTTTTSEPAPALSLDVAVVDVEPAPTSEPGALSLDVVVLQPSEPAPSSSTANSGDGPGTIATTATGGDAAAQPAPAKRGRGRPKGSTKKPKPAPTVGALDKQEVSE